MEESNAQKQIFTIKKDNKKKKFIMSHTFNNISQYIPGQYNIFDLKNKNNQKNSNNFKNENKNINRNKQSIDEEIEENNNKIKLKVILNYSYQKDYFEFCLPTKVIYNQEQNLYQFYLNDIIDLIHSYSNEKTIFLNEDYGISYYTNDENMNNGKDEDIKTYFFVGNFPLDNNINYCINIPSDGILYLKFRKCISKIKSLRYDIFEEENEEEIEEVDEQNKSTAQLNYNVSSKRAKEKRIGYIIKKVFEWKGFRKYTDNKMSLIEAAANVHLSKKTLDEYFNQIKEGKKYNFDFNKHKKDKVNILRGYVKKMNNQDNNKIKLDRKIRNKK